MAPQTLETRLLSDDMNDRSTDPMTVPTVARLLDAVEILCAKKAPSNVTMREVATAAGLSLGVAYRYYASREELFGAAMDRMADQIVAAATGDTPITAVTAPLESTRGLSSLPSDADVACPRGSERLRGDVAPSAHA